MDINLTLKFEWVKRIFANEEYNLMTGEHVFFSKRMMLEDIYNQLTEDCQREIIIQYPKVSNLLAKTNKIKLSL
jgi:hypothetical protein